MMDDRRIAQHRHTNAFLVGIGCAALWLTGGHLAAADSVPEPLKAAHVLNRLAFGPRPGDVERVQAMGVDAYIREQLQPDAIPIPDSLQQALAPFSTLRLSAANLFSQYGPPQTMRHSERADRRAAAKEARHESKLIVEETQQARLLLAIDSPRQLQEVMVEFWYNHFNVFAHKQLDRLWVGAYEREAIRPYALGRFRDLLGATAKHPAMLEYLDNWKNTAPGSPGARGAFNGLNENYARELMELHTLGVNGGYTQQDVITLARILTGWTYRRHTKTGVDIGFFFDARRHDTGEKVLLGHRITGRGEAEGEEALDLLARHPSTARHLCYQLAQYFVADEPDPALVDQLAQRFLATDGNIREVLLTLFHSPQFWDQRAFNAKFKTPYQFLVSSVRATGVPVADVRHLEQALQQLGMPLYGCLTPDGYKNTQDAWLSPDAILRRINIVTALTTGNLHLDPSGNRGVDPNRVLSATGAWLSEHTRQAVEASPERLRAAVILGSPECMRR